MVKMTCFRFNLDNPEHAKAWNYLHNYDKPTLGKLTLVSVRVPRLYSLSTK